MLDDEAIDGQVRFDDEIEMTAGNRNDVHFRKQAIPSSDSLYLGGCNRKIIPVISKRRFGRATQPPERPHPEATLSSSLSMKRAVVANLFQTVASRNRQNLTSSRKRATRSNGNKAAGARSVQCRSDSLQRASNVS